MLMRFIKAGGLLSGVILLLITTVYFVRAFDARNMMPLSPAHRITLDREYHAGMEPETNWSDYVALEYALAEELTDKLSGYQSKTISIDRHTPGSLSNPDTFGVNWNRSHVLEPKHPLGAAVLLHGLTDSPYSVRSTAERFYQMNITAYAPRLPGHGFAVGSLRQVHWEDWLSVVRIAMREADSHRDTGPLLLAGYSNGGLLAVRYALECRGRADLPCPDGILLISPAFEVTPFAQLADWHHGISWLKYFEQFQWQSILPEIDPFKFTSFPKNAGREIHELSNEVRNKLATLEDHNKSFPRTISFQSLVDKTVNAEAVVGIFRLLPGDNHELVLYDVNRHEFVIELMKDIPSEPASFIDDNAPFNFSFTVITNSDPEMHNVSALELKRGETVPVRSELDLAWPNDVYSLSHIALPFPADDPVYGRGDNEGSLNLGAIAPRGEGNVLYLNPDYFLRLRHNPFYPYQEERITNWTEKFIR